MYSKRKPSRSRKVVFWFFFSYKSNFLSRYNSGDLVYPKGVWQSYCVLTGQDLYSPRRHTSKHVCEGVPRFG